MLANISIHEPKPAEDPDSPLAFSMEGNPNQPPGALIPFFWAPGWNSIQSTNKFQTEIAGALRGGDPGVRLIEPAAGAAAPVYFGALPEGFAPRPGAWLAVPLYHIFGSEELSAAAPAVRELVPKPYIALNAEDARELGIEEGQRVQVTLGEARFELPLRIAALGKGLAGLPAGLPDFREPSLPAWVGLSRSS
jgi:NADH-quinone oxidoreductase subunit G